MKLNEKILYYRKKAGLSQEALAAKVGVSRQAVSKWEVGDATPELDKLLGLARAFGVTTDHLLDDGAEPSAPTSAAQEATPPPAPVASEDLRWVLERRAKFSRWYNPIFIGLVTLVVGIYGSIAGKEIYDLVPYMGWTVLLPYCLSAALAVEGAGMIIWGAVRLVRHRREEKKTSGRAEKR